MERFQVLTIEDSYILLQEFLEARILDDMVHHILCESVIIVSHEVNAYSLLCDDADEDD